MIKNKLLTTLVLLGLISLSAEPYIVSAQTPDGTSTSGASVLIDENFESTDNGQIPSGWSQTGDWGVAWQDVFGNALWGDYTNIPYKPNTASTISTQTVDLSGATSATVDFITRCDTDYTPNSDFMTLQASGDNGSTFTDIMTWNEPTIDTDTNDSSSAVKSFTGIAIPSDLLTSQFKLGFKWQTDETRPEEPNGCIIDNVKLTANGGGSTGGTGTSTPGTGTTTPGTGTSTPGTGTSTPGTGTSTPGTGTSTPGTGTSTPGTGTSTPGTGTSTPGTGTSTPGTGTTTPGTGTTTPGTGTSTPGTGTGTTTDEGAHQLTACADLSEEGTTYTLMQNISTSNSCFIIRADHITLDGGGFTITGDNSSGHSAVEAQSVTGIQIKNLTATNFNQALSFTSVNNATFDSNNLNNNVYGFVLHAGSGNVIKNSTANNNQNVGIYVQNGTNTTIEGNTANNNSVGINLDASNQNIVSNNTATSNDRGILLLGSSNNAINSNTANQNSFGIALENGSEHNTVVNNTQNDNNVALAVGSGHNSFKGLRIDGSLSKAIRFFDSNSAENTIEDSVITNTNSAGYDLSFDPAGLNYAAAVVNGTIISNTPLGKYVISNPGTLTINNPYGGVEALDHVSGTGENLSSDIVIESGKITIASSTVFGGKRLRLTMNNTIAEDSDIQKNGTLCSECSDFSANSGATTISFTIVNPGVYTTTGTTTAIDTGTSTPGTGTSTPGTGTSTPGTGTSTPGTGTSTPGTGTSTPGTGTSTPGTGTSTPETPTPTPTPTPVVSYGGGGGGSIITNYFARGSDLNGDGRVDLFDLSILMRNWSVISSNTVGDINADGKIDLLDLNLMMVAWTR